MRRNLASPVVVCCAAALALPLTAPTAHATPAAPPASRPVAAPPAAGTPGSTRSLPLAPLTAERSGGRSGSQASGQGLLRSGVRPFSLLGLVWDDPDAELDGRVRVRTRAVGGNWSAWRELETHNADHAADPGTAERTRGTRGATAPLWVGRSDGVQVRVDPGGDRLPTGLHLDLVDPGPAPADPSDDPSPGAPGPAADTRAEGNAAASAEANADLDPADGTIPPLTRDRVRTGLDGAQGPGGQAAPYAAARPSIVTRAGWGADESLRESGFVYTNTVKAAFVHHSATGNDYTCAEAPAVIRGIYRYHVNSEHWRDIGYNFLVDKCGKIYEGRAGGVAKPVLGAHTLGFNTDTTGIAVLGTFTSTAPTEAALDSVAALAAWKLGLTGADPAGKTTLVSGGGNLYPKGEKARLDVLSGHRDGFNTECPGAELYSRLGGIRADAAKRQGR
ncbi:peptidoglycan recognition protein [Streptomyces sp. NPDC058045]|uniref:peptidoglycan recognition protein family protein n=1 Tax=Streptomyces sp. NPDC058045 TaxID=3346311 RepID=UPI0036E4A5E9